MQTPLNTTSYSRLKPEYTSLYNAATIPSASVLDPIVDKIVKYKSTYDQVGIAPWYFIGAIHHMESDQDFNTHLFNGDPLTHRTVNEPVGYPKEEPDTPNGYSWVFSAKAALIYDNWNNWPDWTVIGGLYKVEAYNGWGYRLYHQTFTPYLWSGTQFYVRGKYNGDGHYDPTVISKQIGVVPILKRMVQRALI